jgi:integrase/recombinase XerD
MRSSGNFAMLLEKFFTERMMHQMRASSNTIASYRDTFILLLQYTTKHLKKHPSDLIISDLSADLILRFLEDLEKTRGLKARCRNVRLSAIRSFFKYLSYQIPEASGLISQILAIPNKKFTKKLIHYLTREEVDALLQVPDQRTWIGRRDFALILIAVQTGLRQSELIQLKKENVNLHPVAYVQCIGKGRKERCTPLNRLSIRVLQKWFKELENQGFDFVFPTLYGKKMSPDNFRYLLEKYTKIAQLTCPSLKNKRVSPHVFRHTAAMQFLQAGIDISTIALWLGHESIETTQIYLEADLAIKEAALKKIQPANAKVKRYKADDQLESFLKNL